MRLPGRRFPARAAGARSLLGLALVLAAAMLPARGAPAASDPGPTPFERAGGGESPSLEETYGYLQTIARGCRHVQLTSFGVSAEGRPLPLVLVYDRGEGAEGWDNGAPKPVVMIVAGIHSGEICGNDALQLLLRDIARGQRPEIVAHLRLVLVPVFNVDGHARTSPFNRLTQNGPANGTGTRRNAQRLDLNRDFTKLESPEVAALVRLAAQFQPDIVLDLHTNDGFDYQYDLLYGALTDPTLPGERGALLRELDAALREGLRARGFLGHAFGYPIDECDLGRGIAAYPLSAHLGYGYFDRRHALSLIVEAHPYIPYERRVGATHALIDEALAFAAARRIELTETVARAREAAQAWAREPGAHAIALDLETDLERGRTIEWLGKVYEVVTSEVTGRRYARYAQEPLTYRLPFHEELRPTVTATLPRGYLVSAGWGEAAERLRAHCLRVQSLTDSFTAEVEVFRGRDPRWSRETSQGHHPLVAVAWERARERRAFPPGTLWISCDQPGGIVAAHLLEPEAPVGLLAWNLFDTIFERDITLEPWSLEENARRMLAEDPEARAAYGDALADSAFAADPDARLEFFFRRTPYLQPDEGLYPVFRVMGEPPRALRP